MDSEIKRLRIKNYSISMPTLEDVFIKLSKLSNNNDNLIVELNDKHNNSILFDDNNYEIQDNYKKIIRGLIVSFKKRLYQIIREIKAILIEIICPILLTLIGCTVGYIKIIDENRTFPFQLNQLTNDSHIILYSFTNNMNIDNLIFNYQGEDISNILFKQIEFNKDFNDFRNIEDSFIDIYNEHHEIQKMLNKKSYVYYIISEIDDINQKYEFNCIIDITARQAAPVYPNFVLNNIIKYATKNKDLNVEIINEPLPINEDEIVDELKKNKFMILFFTSLAFSLIPTNFITIIIKERENNSKHLQIISGISLFSYWVINYLFELIKYYVIGGICIFILFLFGFYEDYLYILYLLYGPSMISFTYFLSFVFKSEDVGQIFILLINLVIGVLGGSSIILMRLNEDLKELSKKIINIFRLIPSFCFCYGFNQLTRITELFSIDMRIKINFNSSDIFSLSFEFGEKKDILKIDYIGADCIYLSIEAIFFLFLIIIIENFLTFINCFKYCFCSDNNTNEINRVLNNENNNSITVKNLTKIYYENCFCKNVNAIKNISFKLNQGEIFGFLGVNGAGKTTTFKCLANEIFPNYGNIYIDNYDVTKHFNKVRNLIGYCPQFDAIFGYLTVYENLKFYGLIKGAKIDKLHSIITSILTQMNLLGFKDSISETLSGGNKRKLSVSIALICNPPIILLDEPSTGMDPEARRYMWKAIHNISLYKKKSTIIMTTHSMEEAETLCEKIGILINGKFKCLNTCDQIKTIYGYGFEINFQINEPDINDIYKIFYVSDEDKNQIIHINDLDECFSIYYLDKYKSQLKEGLFGEKLLEEIKTKGCIPFIKILLWIYYLKCALSMINLIKEYFPEIYCIDYGENNFVFKIKRYKTNEEKSIGFLFGLIEANKNKFSIGPYYLRYSSLEQIFNKFARENNGNNNNINQNQIEIEINQELLDNFLK